MGETMTTPRIDRDQPYGEMYLDTDGEAHFECHTQGEDFARTRVAIEKFVRLLQRQLDNESSCPFYER